MHARISSDLLRTILADARRDPHVERCGLLIGQANVITGFVAIVNVAANPEREFALDPAALIAAHRDARATGVQIVGHYHSHPNGQCEPSVTDAAQATQNGQLWMIITADNHGVWQSVENGQMLGRLAPVVLEVVQA